MGRFSVGHPKAVEILMTKLLSHTEDTPVNRRLSRAVSRAQARHQQVSSSNDRGFYHGLLTGYAVAMKVIEGKLTAARRNR